MQLRHKYEVKRIELKGRNRTQRVVIYYRFVGYIEWPGRAGGQNYKADTRKGVAVEYLTDPIPA